jgi:hypothetical protein
VWPAAEVVHDEEEVTAVVFADIRMDEFERFSCLFVVPHCLFLL